MNQWHVATAAEAIAAAQFARCGWDVSVQYGANQPEYDLIVANSPYMLKVSVKGSQDGGWGLTQSYMKDGNYHGAVDTWLARHTIGTIFCFVQFKDALLVQLPRVYIATPNEVAVHLKNCAGGRGNTVLKEKHIWTKRAKGAGTIDEVPSTWIFTRIRVWELAAACTA